MLCVWRPLWGVAPFPYVTPQVGASSWQPPVQGQKVPYADDLCALMELEAEQIALVARHEKIRRTRSGHREQIVVVWVLADSNRGKVFQEDGDIAQFVDEPSRERRGKPLPNFGISGHTHQLVQLLGRGQQIEQSLSPEHDE